MRDDRILIICICIIICVVVIAASAIIITDNQKDAENQAQNTTTVQQTNNTGNNQASSGSNSASSSSQATQTTTNNLPSVKSATFYSDGNPNTGESATINVGSENAGKTINIAVYYYRDGNPMNTPSTQAVTVGQDGSVSYTDYTAMPKYPDMAEIDITYNGNTESKTFSLGKYKGSQTKYA